MKLRERIDNGLNFDIYRNISDFYLIMIKNFSKFNFKILSVSSSALNLIY